MTDIVVHVDIEGTTERAGVAYVTVGRRRVSTTFAYDPDYLGRQTGFDLEPNLPRMSGQQFMDKLPGSFQDCSPDRWGRNLINKRRRAEERLAGARRLPAITEIDYLLGVSDLTRQGDLRFSRGNSGEFLDVGHTVPKLVSLPELLRAADVVAGDGDDLAAIKTLLEAGSGSLGGARPKASVLGENGELLIAKFPHREDEWDVMAWEKCALDLAAASGIDTPARRLTDVGGRWVLVLDRFDRRRSGARVGYISAMTLLDKWDGDEGDYLEIAEALPVYGANVTRDLHELYRRIVFNVAIHNTDDHLRNHGFLRAPGGWTLSPIFDVNPSPDIGRGRVTGIGGSVAPEDEVVALHEVAGEFRLREHEARSVAQEVVHAVATWREVASGNGISSNEQTRFGEVLDGRIQALREQFA